MVYESRRGRDADRDPGAGGRDAADRESDRAGRGSGEGSGARPRVLSRRQGRLRAGAALDAPAPRHPRRAVSTAGPAAPAEAPAAAAPSATATGGSRLAARPAHREGERRRLSQLAGLRAWRPDRQGGRGEGGFVRGWRGAGGRGADAAPPAPQARRGRRRGRSPSARDRQGAGRPTRSSRSCSRRSPGGWRSRRRRRRTSTSRRRST